MFKYRYREFTEGNLVEEITFKTRKEAREHLNSKVRKAKAENKHLRTYYQETNDFYSVKDLRLDSDIKEEDEGKRDLGDEEPKKYMEIDEIYMDIEEEEIEE